MRPPTLLSSLLLVALAACGSDAPSAPSDPVAARAAAFDAFWQDYDATYPYFDYKHVDWSAGRDALRARAAATTTDSAFVAVLRDALAPLRDVHAWLVRPDGTSMPSYVSTRAANWNRDLWLATLPRLGWHQGSGNWGWGRIGDVGYLAISAWSDAQVKVADVDAALDQLRDTRALVLDVRMNGGGNDALALQVAGRFTSGSVRFGAVRYRSGPSHGDFTGWTDRTLAPRGPWTYAKPVVVLAGAACFSSNETFVAAMGELPNVTLMGDTTGGGSGNPKLVGISIGERDTKWQYALPRWIEATASGTYIEWNGVAPDVRVPFDATSGRDAVLDAALARLGVAPP